MNWEIDTLTYATVQNRLNDDLLNLNLNINQFGGRAFNPNNWLHRVENDIVLMGINNSSPENIIQCFGENHLLEGLALVVSWGTMARTGRYIYTRTLGEIENVLQRCIEDLLITQSIDNSWCILTENLQWSPVIISKTLHFICRAIGFDLDHPVPIDRKVILQNVYPVFIAGTNPIPGKWENGLEGFKRYMTFINGLRHCHYPELSNTQIEARLFHYFYPNRGK